MKALLSDPGIKVLDVSSIPNDALWKLLAIAGWFLLCTIAYMLIKGDLYIFLPVVSFLCIAIALYLLPLNTLKVEAKIDNIDSYQLIVDEWKVVNIQNETFFLESR